MASRLVKLEARSHLIELRQVFPQSCQLRFDFNLHHQTSCIVYNGKEEEQTGKKVVST